MRRAGPLAYAGMVVIAAIYGVPFLSLVTTSLKTNTQIFAGGLLFTPTFYVVCRGIGERIAARRSRHEPALVPAE